MSSTKPQPTRREEKRAQTVHEIKELAMAQVSAGGPDSVSLSGIVREMSMSPAALYRYFDSRDALLADLVVDAYNDLADSLVGLDTRRKSPDEKLAVVLRGTRTWASKHPNAYRLIFQTSIGSGQDFAVERTVLASARSMAVIVGAIAGAAALSDGGEPGPGLEVSADTSSVITMWAERSGLTEYSVDVLMLALLSWTRLHGIISLELGGHLAATGVGPDMMFEAEVGTIRRQAAIIRSTGGGAGGNRD